ncbi:MAG: hypothetical protein HC853_05020 [Anaerolineae bacterium]|nr:hypothetical protein [Anaerolineae bacterium]
MVALAGQGDEVCVGIVQRGALALTQAVLAVARALGLPGQTVPLALTGGLLLNAALVRARVLEHLRTSSVHFDPINLVQQPVDGAVRIAQSLHNS